MPEEDHPKIERTGQDSIEKSDAPVGEPWPMTADDVCQRWDITSGKLKLLVQESKLPAYHKGFEGRSRVDPTDSLWTVVGRPHFWYFMSDDIEEFEQKHLQLLSKKGAKNRAEGGLLKNQIYKERCRALAEYFWSKFKDDTIEGMSNRHEMIKIG